MVQRCFGNGVGKENYAHYHDTEWGIPIHDDNKLFELLTLEGAQAGLSWEIILNKRTEYNKCFYNFDIYKVADMPNSELDYLVNNANIIKHKAKIYSVPNNARIVIDIKQKHHSFNHYLWSYVDHKTIFNHWHNHDDVPTATNISTLLSKNFKKMGMKFVGPTIMYSYMQAVGMVNDHLTSCWKYGK